MANDKKISCEECKKEIPKSAAITHEGADYIYHFCCPECMDHYFKEHPDLQKKGESS